MVTLQSRNIHLDFHTAPQIPDIGKDFQAEKFVQTLKDAHVNGITCFAKCHHGMLYYNSKKFAAAKHPNLSFDLFAAQLNACEAAGIAVTAYISAGWDELAAKQHPEWLEVDITGKRVGPAPLEKPTEARGWMKLCFNSPYVNYLEAQTLEVLEMFPSVTGIFYDITWQGECVCPRCIEDMLKLGLDPEKASDRQQFAVRVRQNLLTKLSQTVRSKNNAYRIFYNNGHVDPKIRGVLHNFSHLEIESLPSGGWGYDHFPITVRFAQNLGLDYIGQTGRFHKSWGDFGGMKNQAALEFECFSALALGAKCSIGDQLHPRGELDRETYKLIGIVFRQVAEKESWCQDAEPVNEVAVFNPEAVGQRDQERIDTAMAGAYRILSEANYQFAVIDGECDFNKYKVIILPDKITLTPQLRDKMAAYLAQGGKVLATYKSGLWTDEKAFALPEFGIEFCHEAEFPQEYFVARPSLAKGIPDTQHILYERGLRIKTNKGTQILADVWRPYFARSYKHFCSHYQTPVDQKIDYPAVTSTGNVIYSPYPLFGMYRRHGSRVYKQLLLNSLAQLLPDREKLVQVNAPTTAQCILNYQAKEQRYVFHILHYIPLQRAEGLEVIEDVHPLYDIQTKLKLPQAVKEVCLVPQGIKLAYRTESTGHIKFVVPKVNGHQMISLAVEF